MAIIYRGRRNRSGRSFTNKTRAFRITLTITDGFAKNILYSKFSKLFEIPVVFHATSNTQSPNDAGRLIIFHFVRFRSDKFNRTTYTDFPAGYERNILKTFRRKTNFVSDGLF